MRTVLLLGLFQLAALAEPLRSGCSPSDPEIGPVTASDRIQVEMALAGEQSQTCYRVVVTRNGTSMSGYVLGESLPAVADFVHRRERASKQAADEEARREEEARRAKARATSKVAAKPQPETGPQGVFENFYGRDLNGHVVSLSSFKGRVILVSFWSPKSGKSQGQLTAVRPLYNQFHANGLTAVGVSMDSNWSHIKTALDDVIVPFPQIADQSGLADRYGVDAKVGKTFVLDADYRIVASGQMGPDMEATVRKLMVSGRQ